MDAAERRRRAYALLRELVDLLIVDDAEPAVYSTHDPACWPRGCRSRRHARDRIRRVPGHERIGRGPATQWAVSRDAYRAHYTRAPEASTSDVEAIATAALAAAKLRRTK